MSKVFSVEDILTDKVTVISEEERLSDDLKHPTKFFIVNALGEGVYFHTRSRATAQEWADTIYGKGFYKVRAVIKASVS